MSDAPALTTIQFPVLDNDQTTVGVVQVEYIRRDIFDASRMAVDAMLNEKLHITDAVRLAYAAQSCYRLNNIQSPNKTGE